MDLELNRRYGRSKSPIAFLDESYQIEGDNRFYILACAVVATSEISDSRAALLQCNGGEVMHAAPMFHNHQHSALRAGIEISATHHDGIDVIIQSELEESDADGVIARRRCVEHAVSVIHDEFATTLFVFDSLRTRKLERLDYIAINDLKRGGQIGRDVSAIHTRPSAEPLLGLPDLLAWSYRQKFVSQNESWFAPYEPLARIHEI